MEEKIIKARPATEAVGAADGRFVKREIYDAGLEARSLLDSARKEAAAIIAEAREGRDTIVQAGREQGFRQGLAEWHGALEGLREAQQALESKYEPEIIRMAVKIAGKVIGEELRSRPEAIASIARECLRGVRHEHNLTLRINPKEVEEVQRNLNSLLEIAGRDRRIQVLADGAVAPGGCVVDSAVGVIDARLETQLRCLEEILLRIAGKS